MNKKKNTFILSVYPSSSRNVFHIYFCAILLRYLNTTPDFDTTTFFLILQFYFGKYQKCAVLLHFRYSASTRRALGRVSSRAEYLQILNCRARAEPSSEK